MLKILEGCGPLTLDHVERAIELVDEGTTCKSSEHGCIHAEAMKPVIGECVAVATRVATRYCNNNNIPTQGPKYDDILAKSIMFAGVHIGYGLALVHLGLDKEDGPIS